MKWIARKDDILAVIFTQRVTQPTFVVAKMGEEKKLQDNVTKFKLSEFSEPKRSKSPNAPKPQENAEIIRKLSELSEFQEENCPRERKSRREQ